MNCANMMAKQVWLEEERWKPKRLAWLGSISFQPILSRGQQHEGRRGQAQEWSLRQERGQAWACLHVTPSSEKECGEFRQARTGLQESDGFIVLGLKDLPILLADHRVVQHGATVLSSETEVSGHVECGLRAQVNKCMRHSKQAHCVLVMDGDHAHIKQGLDTLQCTPV